MGIIKTRTGTVASAVFINALALATLCLWNALPVQAATDTSRQNEAHDVGMVAAGVEKLQYRLDASGIWADVPSPLPVLVGRTVEFRALSNPPGASGWPSGKPAWSGTSGARGSDETTKVVFKTVSATATDFKTVIANCGNDITANVVVYDARLEARRKGSEYEFGTEVVVAAGHRDTDEHKGELLVQTTPALEGVTVGGVRIKSGGEGGNDAITATAMLNGNTTDAKGQLTGTFISGHRASMTVVEFDADPDAEANRLSTVNFAQVWNELGSFSWTVEGYFEHDKASTLTYAMAFEDDVPITNHLMDYETQSIGGLEWDASAGDDVDGDGLADGDYVERTYSFDDVDTKGFDRWSPLVTYSSAYEEPAGAYNTKQIIAFHKDFLADYVGFHIVDTQCYDETGA